MPYVYFSCSGYTKDLCLHSILGLFLHLGSIIGLFLHLTSILGFFLILVYTAGLLLCPGSIPGKILLSNHTSVKYLTIILSQPGNYTWEKNKQFTNS